MKKDVYEYERELTKQIKEYARTSPNRHVPPPLITAACNRLDWLEWAQAPEVRQTLPDLLPDIRYHRRWHVAAFRTLIPMP